MVASPSTLLCHKKSFYHNGSIWLFCCVCYYEIRLIFKILTMKTRILFLISVLSAVTFLNVSCYKSKSSYNSATTSKISITSSAYSPASLTIANGSTVTWTNNDNMVHTVTTAEGSINSGDIAPGSSYSKTFTTAGTFNYYDAHNTDMKGVLIITTSTGGGY